MHPVMGQVAKGMIITGAFAAALGMAFWVGSTQRDEAYMRFITEESAKESAKPASSEPRDRLAIAACIEFNQAANDAMDRVATEYQTSQRLPKVFEDGGSRTRQSCATPSWSSNGRGSPGTKRPTSVPS